MFHANKTFNGPYLECAEYIHTHTPRMIETFSWPYYCTVMHVLKHTLEVEYPIKIFIAHHLWTFKI